MYLYLDLSLCSLLLYSMTTWTGLGKIVPPNDVVVPTRFGANESSLLVVWASSSSCHGHETKDQKKKTKTKHKGKKQEDETAKLTSPTTKTIGRKTADDPHHQHYLRLLWMPLLIVRSFVLFSCTHYVILIVSFSEYAAIVSYF